MVCAITVKTSKTQRFHGCYMIAIMWTTLPYLRSRAMFSWLGLGPLVFLMLKHILRLFWLFQQFVFLSSFKTTMPRHTKPASERNGFPSLLWKNLPAQSPDTDIITTPLWMKWNTDCEPDHHSASVLDITNTFVSKIPTARVSIL